MKAENKKIETKKLNDKKTNYKNIENKQFKNAKLNSTTQKIIICVSVVVIALIVLLSASYAYWKNTEYQTGVNIIASDCFDVTFEELSSSINLNNTYPMPDNKGIKKTPYIFKIKNICSVKASYDITLNTLNNSKNKIPDNLIKYVFYESSSTVSVGSYLSNATVNTNTSILVTDLPIITSYKLAEGVLEKDDEKEFVLKLWIAEEATTSINGYSFESAINVRTVATH